MMTLIFFSIGIVAVVYYMVMTVKFVIKEKKSRHLVKTMKVQVIRTSPTSRSGRPAPRSGHRITCHNGCLYTFGGYSTRDNAPSPTEAGCLFSELWCLNLSTGKWEELNCTGDIPHEVASHTMARQNNTLLVFGGTGSPFGLQCSNTVSLCHIEQKTWKVLTTTGEKPQKLYGQASRLAGSYFYVMGGTSGLNYFNDLHRLDLKTGVWEKLGDQNGPMSRYRHEIAVYDDRIFVIGGGTATNCFSLKKIAVFCLARRRWTYTRAESDEVHGHPFARKCHSTVQKDHLLYVSGGLGNDGGLYDVWLLNLKSLLWSKLPIELPVAVYFHDMDMYQGCLYIFGGVVDRGRSRTNSVLRCWVEIPSLQELCWVALVQKFPCICNLSHDQLLQIGIPAVYAKRLLHPKLNS